MYDVMIGRRLSVRVHVKAVALASLLGALCFASSARAQSDEGAGASSDEASADAEAPHEGAEAKPPVEPVSEPAADEGPLEKDGKAYRFIGLRFRNIIVPKAFVNIFADGGATVNVFSFGPEFTTRKDNFELDLALSYADYSMDPFLFKGKNDGNDAWEIVSSDMKLLYLTADLLYEIPLDKATGRFSILLGGGVGLGIVFGNLYRAQAYPTPGASLDPNDVSHWRRCEVVGEGGIAAGTGNVFCDGSNEHYGNYDEPSWVNGGAKPSVFPWISFPQVSFRFKPIKQLQIRADAGLAITGVFFGMSAGYGL